MPSLLLPSPCSIFPLGRQPCRPRLLLAAALCGVLFAASLVIAPPASAQDVTIWSADLDVKALNSAQDEFGCSHSTPFNIQCSNSSVLDDDDFKLHGTTYTIRRIEDDGSRLDLTLDKLLPENVLEILTLNLDDDTGLDFDDANVSSSNKRYRWSSSSPSWSSGDDVELSITDSSGPSLVKNTSLAGNDRNLFENGHRSAQAFTAGTWARVTSIGIGIGDEVDDDVEVTLHKGGGSDPGDRLITLENPSSITADSVNVFTVPDGGIVLEASKTYFVQVKTTSSDRVAVSVTIPQSDGNDEDAGGEKNWTIDNDSRINRPSVGAWQASNQSMRIDVKGQVLLPPPTNPSARAVAPMRVTLEWDRTLPSLTGTIDRDDGYRIEWSAAGNTSWTSLVNYTNQHGTFEIWCVCYPTRFNDDTITPGTTRHYRIKAVDDDEESAWSEVVSATTPALVDSDGGTISVGATKSELAALNDQKVFQINLQSGEYRFRVSGDAPKHRVIVTDLGGAEIENFVLGTNEGLLPRITAQSSGIHLIKISHGGGFGNAGAGSLKAGSFQFQLVPVSDPAVGTLRLPGTSTLFAVLNSYGDVDRAELAVQPGKAYAVEVHGREENVGSAATPWIQRADPPGIYTHHHMDKPWVDGVTTTETSNSICAEPGDNEARCEEFQAFVIDLRGLTGAEQTWQIYVAPTARRGTRPYRVGTYTVELTELLFGQLQGVRMPLRAWFASPPAQHDGSKRFKVQVGFNESLDGSPEHGVEVEGGEVTSVRPVGGNAQGGAGTRSVGGPDEGPEDRDVVWEFEIEPDSDADVTVSLPEWRPCDGPGAICTADGRVLSQGGSTTVRGPRPSVGNNNEGDSGPAPAGTPGGHPGGNPGGNPGGGPGDEDPRSDDAPPAPVGYLENPGPDSFQSGIGVISGWVCEADAVEIEIETVQDAVHRYEAGYGTARADTAQRKDGTPLCGDTDNGFGLLFNWNLLGEGDHEVVALVDGVELGRATVTVTTVGAGAEAEFLRDVAGTCEVEDFPLLGESVTVAWQETQQNFVITSGPRPVGENRAGMVGMGYLENPGPDSFQSGIGVISGWVCEAAEVEIAIETAGREVRRERAAYGTERADTAQRKDGTLLCGDTDNGFGLLFNWNLLGEGEHTVRALVDGAALGWTTVRVTTVGTGDEEEFLREVEGECVVEDFPMVGETVTLEWQQNSQNFVITDVE